MRVRLRLAALLLATAAAPVAADPPAPRPEAAVSEAPPPRQDPVVAATPAPVNAFASALDAARDGDWIAAEVAIAGVRDPLAPDILLWLRLRDGAGTWEEYRSFLVRHPNWPGLATLRRAGERLIPESASPETVTAWFDGRAPQTGAGSLRLAAALSAEGDTTAAEAEAVRGWRSLSLSPGEQAAFRSRWGAVLAPHHVARLDMLLWQGWTQEAEAMLPLVDADWQALARARIATRRDAEGLQSAIWAVPKPLKKDPGLAFERYRYRVTKARWDEAEQYLRTASTSAEALGRPEMWMPRRANLARQALARDDVDGAYAIAAGSFGSSGSDYADAEWLAGYIALTRMQDPDRAAEHFRRFGAAVFTPISLGRAGYWLGLALEQGGDAEGAAAAWRAGGRHQTSFYGQLAAERAGLDPDGRLAAGEAPDWARSPITRTSVARAAVLFHEAGDDERAMQFLRHAAEGKPADGRAALAEMARAIGLPQAGVRIGKDAAAEGVIIPAQYYPLHPIAAARWPVPTEYALAIARQESEFDATAKSSAGARGLMQLMPATAEHMASLAGTRFDLERLGRDPTYNARLGTEYLSRMLKRYRGSYILATASYNAGPGRVDEWLRTLGDPRGGAVDPVDWIESIPFSETRNYVMRVLEALHVYRLRLEGEAAPVQLTADLTRTG